MKNFKHKKIIIVFAAMLFLLTGCANYRGKDGKTKVETLIALEDYTVKKSEVSISKDLEAEYEQYGPEDDIVIPKTTFKDTFKKDGIFSAIIVYPIAQLMNWIATFTNAGVGMILGSAIILAVTFILTIKQQVSTQKMQEIQPQLQAIQAKYAGKTDNNSRMKMAQEQQGLYKKNNISMFGSLITSFIQFPIMFGMLYASYRAVSIVNGDIFGIPLNVNVSQSIMSFNIAVIAIYVLMIGFQFLSIKVPTMLADKRKKESGIKVKKYVQEQNKAAGGMNMNGMLYGTILMTAMFAFSFPLSMTLYYLVQSVIRVIQNIVVHKFFLSSATKK